PRLFLARKLLKDTGFIFISIDDNEYANLKLMMDEIFGEGGFVITIARLHSRIMPLMRWIMCCILSWSDETYCSPYLSFRARPRI
ncbi:DNA methyltransferase, partial [Salmonella enterica subsp. enterica serovar Anatum]|nr:DNA methyltransferase [Salmonella enterica subsp. enterica serovar Anatum]